MKKSFNQIPTKENTPQRDGWYHTSKGQLFWMHHENNWSCRDDQLSEEYPEFWYEEIIPPTAEAKIRPLKKPYQPDEYMPETWKNDPIDLT
jgi:hypothetical protein